MSRAGASGGGAGGVTGGTQEARSDLIGKIFLAWAAAAGFHAVEYLVCRCACR